MRKLFILISLVFLSASPQGQQKWVAIGDSITYLNDHHDEAGNRITKGYLTLIHEKHPEITAINKGFNGWTSGDVANKIESLGLETADIYSVFLGTNDWWQGRPIGSWMDYQNSTGSRTIYGAFRIIVDKLRTLNKKAKIILITPMQRGDFVYLGDMTNNAYGSYRDKNGQTLKAVAMAIKDIANRENLAVVDVYHDSGIVVGNVVAFKRLKDPATGKYRNYNYPEYTKIPFNPKTDEYPYPKDAIDMTYDGLHPSDKAYKIIASMIERALRLEN